MKILIDGNEPVPEICPDRFFCTMAATGLSCALPDVQVAVCRGAECRRKAGSLAQGDVFLCLSGAYPESVLSSPALKVAAVGSLDFVSAPDGYSWFRRHHLNLLMHRICRHSDHFIVPDGKTAVDLKKYYYISPERISVYADVGSIPSILLEIMDLRQKPVSPR